MITFDFSHVIIHASFEHHILGTFDDCMAFRRRVLLYVYNSDRHNSRLGQQQKVRPYDPAPVPVLGIHRDLIPVQTRFHCLFFPLESFLSFLNLIETILNFFERGL